MILADVALVFALGLLLALFLSAIWWWVSE